MKGNLELIGLCLSIIANIVGFLVWYNSAQRKRYAAESAFERIEETNREILRILEGSRQRQIEVAQQIRDKLDISLNSFVRESQIAQNEIVGELKEVKACIQVLTVATTGDTISGIMNKRMRRTEE